MRGCLAKTLHGRAIIGVIALYALLLQPFLAAATPAMMPDAAGILCATHDGPAPSGPAVPGRSDHQCCTAAFPGGPVPPPAASAVVSRMQAIAVAVSWYPEAAIGRPGPTTHSHSPRGPPAA